MKNEDYVSFEQAKALKEFGFDWKCEIFWDDEGSPHEQEWVLKHYHDYPFVTNGEDCTVLRPTLAQAQKWLREVKGILISVSPRVHPDKTLSWLCGIADLFKMIEGQHFWSMKNIQYDFYEIALSAGINEALEILKIENNEKRS